MDTFKTLNISIDENEIEFCIGVLEKLKTINGHEVHKNTFHFVGKSFETIIRECCDIDTRLIEGE